MGGSPVPPAGLDDALHSMEEAGEPSPLFFGTHSTNHKIRWNQGNSNAFSTARVRPPRATLLPLVHAPGRALVSLRHRKPPPHRSMRRAASQPCRPPAGRRAARVCPTGRAPGDGQRTTTCRTRQDGWLRPRGHLCQRHQHGHVPVQRSKPAVARAVPAHRGVSS
jgi:hypothetical protein